jgi:hypothetical protein
MGKESLLTLPPELVSLEIDGRLRRLEEAHQQRHILYQRLQRAERRVMALAEVLGLVTILAVWGGIGAYIYLSRALSMWDWLIVAAVFVGFDLAYVRAWRGFLKD